MTILAHKLVTGEEVLGETEIKDDKLTITNPVGIAVVRGKDGTPNVGFSPFPIHSEQKIGATIDIAQSSVIYSYTPAEDFVSNYNQIFGSGLVIPPKKEIILG